MLATSRMTEEPRSGALHGRPAATREGDPKRQEKLFTPHCTTVACAAALRPSPPQCRGLTPLQSCSPTAEPHQGICQLPPPPCLGSRYPQPPCPLPPQCLGRHPPPCPGRHPQPQPHLRSPIPLSLAPPLLCAWGRERVLSWGRGFSQGSGRGEKGSIDPSLPFFFFLSGV